MNFGALVRPDIRASHILAIPAHPIAIAVIIGYSTFLSEIIGMFEGICLNSFFLAKVIQSIGTALRAWAMGHNQVIVGVVGSVRKGDCRKRKDENGA